MGWTIPDRDEAAFGDVQSRIFQVDLEVLRLGYFGYRVESGCEVTEQAVPDMTVHVDAGTIHPGTAELVAVAADDLTVNAAHATLYRLDLITASAAGVATYTAGTAAAVNAVKPPDIPSGHTALAIVTVPPAATTVADDQIVDKRFMLGLNVLSRGGGQEAYLDAGLSGSAKTIDILAASWQLLELDDDCDLTIEGFTVDRGCSMVLEVTGAGTINWTNVTFREGVSDQLADDPTFFVIWSRAGDAELRGAPFGGGSLVWRGAWSSGAAYVPGDAVANDGASYICILGHTNQEPPNATYWDVLAAAGTSIADILDLTTAETDDTLVLAPDGVGGVEFRAEAGGGGGPAELARVEFTSQVDTAQTAEASATQIVSAGAVVFDGSTPVDIEFFCPLVDVQNTANAFAVFYLFDGSSSIGQLGAVRQPTSAEMYVPVKFERRITPSAASHTYSVRFTTSGGTSSAIGGVGGAGAYVPGFIKIKEAA